MTLRPTSISAGEDNALEAVEITVAYGRRHAIDGLCLAVPAGSVYALLGDDGAGKTAAMNTFLGFLRPASGHVRVNGHDVHRDPAVARKHLTYISENVALYTQLTGAENLRYFCALADIEMSMPQAQVLLRNVGLQEVAHHKRAERYSKGMRQKVGFAVAYAKGASAMVLDEPTSGLDPAAARDFAMRVRQAAQAGMGILLATRDLFNTIQVADRIGIMRQGRLVHELDAKTVDHDALQRTYLAHTRDMP